MAVLGDLHLVVALLDDVEGKEGNEEEAKQNLRCRREFDAVHVVRAFENSPRKLACDARAAPH